MVYAAKVNLQFIFNVSLDGNKKIIAAFAGDMEKAHEKAANLFKSCLSAPV